MTLRSLFKKFIRPILDDPNSRRIFLFLILNLSFMFVQMTYGIITNSLGLISDSVHMLFDCIALGIGLLASLLSHRPKNLKYPHGFSKVETLSGFANGVFLILISGTIIFEAVGRLREPEEMNTDKLLLVSITGLIVNLVGVVGFGHGHAHHHHGEKEDCSNSHTHLHAPSVHSTEKLVAKFSPAISQFEDHHSSGSHSHHEHDHKHDHHGHDHHDHNTHGIFLHILADTLGSLGVIISTLLIHRFHWLGFDPLASIFIAVLIFLSVLPLLSSSATSLLLVNNRKIEHKLRNVLQDISEMHGVAAIERMRFYNGCGSLVIKVTGETEGVRRLVRRRLEDVGFKRCVIQVERI